MAIVKHIKSRNANYSAAINYLLFEHDEKTGKKDCRCSGCVDTNKSGQILWIVFIYIVVADFSILVQYKHITDFALLFLYKKRYTKRPSTVLR